MCADFNSIKDARFSIASEEKLKIAKNFIKGYAAARQGLQQLGILRSERNLQGDYAEWLAKELLSLELASNSIQKGYDAKDSNGRLYQIKSRTVGTLEQNTSFDMRSIDEPFDYLVCVFLSQEFDLMAVIKVPYQVVHELGNQTKTTFRFRWNKRVMNDHRIDKVFWQVKKHD